MRDQIMSKPDMQMVPSWVPEAALHYLAHIESGMPIRALARRSGRHASTVLRQIRACETRRDDLLVDEALRRLGQRVGGAKAIGSPAKEAQMTVQTNSERTDDHGTLSNARLQAEARRVLRRLCETGALLAVSVDMDKAVVVRDGGAGQPSRTAVVDREVAEALALKGWIACDNPGRIARYHITGKGRAALGEMLAAAENLASGLRGCAARHRGCRGPRGAPTDALRAGRKPADRARPAARQGRQPLSVSRSGARGRTAARGFRTGADGVARHPELGPVSQPCG
jgi:hypothetical protein